MHQEKKVVKTVRNTIKYKSIFVTVDEEESPVFPLKPLLNLSFFGVPDDSWYPV
jgi:hypothetical protein